MMRAHEEWRRYGSGPWNYEQNEDALKEFWRQGITRMGSYESIVTLGMRGDGDMPMTEGANIALLERIVADQRQILAEVTGKDPAAIPQVWALYKEVQEYYDKGMRVPDDVTLLLCDDNWGNIRRLPALERRSRGQAGTASTITLTSWAVRGTTSGSTRIQIARVWEQMHLAYEYGVRQIWIVNVGDIKPMELPTSSSWTMRGIPTNGRRNACPNTHGYGPSNSLERNTRTDIARILTAYTTYNSRRKPEMLSPDTYSLENYREAERVVEDYTALAAKAQRIYESCPLMQKDAFYQLVLHPVTACANLNELYLTVAQNRLYAKQGRASTNDLAHKVAYLFEKDSAISRYYNTTLAGGKWNHMMDQTHISYTNWQQPDSDVVPETKVIALKAELRMGVAIEGSEHGGRTIRL